jgi:dihydroflavonol-4-reductase
MIRPTVADRLREVRLSRFVGRRAELELFTQVISADPPTVPLLFVHGPDDSAFGESTQLAHGLISGRVPFGAPGAIPVADVRDVASALVAALAPGGKQRRYLAVSEVVSMSTVMEVVARAAGRRPPRGRVPASVLLGMARLADVLQRISPNRLPLDYQSTWTSLHCPDVDATAAVEESGRHIPASEESLVETVHWLRSVEPGLAAQR